MGAGELFHLALFKKRLNHLQLIGVVLSIVWALAAGIQTHNSDVDAANNFAQFAYKVCSDSKSLEHNNDLSSCELKRKEHLETWMKGDYGNVAIVALAPIPLSWLAVFILLYVGRAQIVGFRAVVEWKHLSWFKKAFVAFCAVATFMTFLIGIIVVLNLYVDTQVPVALPSSKNIFKTGDNLVMAEGTWTRSGNSQGSAMGYPLQTSKIKCNRQERRCMETFAYVSGNLLMADTKEYDIQSWTSDSIVFRNDSMCATEVFTIDLNTEAVTGAGHPTNQETPYCKLYPIEETKWTYELSDGFKVYWDERKKARPFFLRFFQSLFGN